MKTQENFETIRRACLAGRLALIECKDARTGEVVEIVAAMSDVEGSTDVDIVPLARMLVIADLNSLQPPNPDGGFFPASEWTAEHEAPPED